MRRFVPLIFVLCAAFGYCQSLSPEASAQLRRATELLHNNNVSKAEETLKHLAERFPKSAEVQETLAVALDIEGKLEEATSHFQQAARLEPHSARAHLNLGANFFRRGKLPAAQLEFETALKLRPADPNIQFNLGMTYLGLRKFDSALPHLLHSHQARPDDFESSYQLALCYFLTGDFVAAGKLLDALVPPAGGEAGFYLLRGLTSHALGKEAESQAAFRKLAELPSAPDVFAKLNAMSPDAATSGKLVPVLEGARAQNPNSYELTYTLAALYHRSGQNDKARGLLRAASETFDTPDLHHLSGEIEEALGNYVTAVKEFQRAAEMAPTEPNLYDLGYEFLAHWSWDAAGEVFRRGLDLTPDSLRLRVGLATAYYGMSDYDKVIDTLLAFPSDQEQSEIANQLLISAFPSSHDRTDAVRKRMSELQRTSRNNAWPNYFYAMALLHSPDQPATQEQRLKAMQLLRQAITLKSDVAQFHYELGLLLFGDHNWRAAVPALERAVKLNPNYVEAYYRLGQAYQRSGDPAKAATALAEHRKLQQQWQSETDRRQSQTAKFIYHLEK
jgi:tetratricopeptide (TPR) repeat protein